MDKSQNEVKPAHTPLPWMQVLIHPEYILGSGQRGDEQIEIKCSTKTLSILNADLIVRAVNSYEDLLVACKAMLSLPGWQANELARAAIVKAEGRSA